MLAKTLEEVDTKLPIEVVDVDENTTIAADFGIRGVPTMIMLSGNTEMKRLVGNKSKKELEEWLNDI